jgi:hypothetical protein
MYAVLCTQGHMTVQEIMRECRENRFSPILSMVAHGDDEVIIPVSKNQNVLQKFAKRNLPKSWGLGGAVALTDRDLKWLESKGFKFCNLEFPRKLKDVVEFDIEILEYEEAPDVMASPRR